LLLIRSRLNVQGSMELIKFLGKIKQNSGGFNMNNDSPNSVWGSTAVRDRVDNSISSTDDRDSEFLFFLKKFQEILIKDYTARQYISNI